MLAYHTSSAPLIATCSADDSPVDAVHLMLSVLKRFDAAFDAAAERGSSLPTPTELKRLWSLAQVAIAAAERLTGERS